MVVADLRRTEKTICLAVSPSLKAYEISGRARLFEVIQKVKEVNALRRGVAPGGTLTGSSWRDDELKTRPELAVDYIVAPPRMALYVDYSTRIYQVYLKYFAPSDLHVYSIDEVMIDATNYLATYGLTARELAKKIILDILHTTGITATAGIGPNLYLSKVAMDIWSKHIPADSNGVRVAKLTEMSYRYLLWNHRPLTDFWRVGRGYAKKLEPYGIFTMGDIARCSLKNEDLLYKLFGVNAELLIDHAWGWEPCAMAHIKAYKPSTNSIVSGQVLKSPYPYDKARIVVREMAELLVMDLVEKGLATNQLVLHVGYDIDNLKNPEISQHYHGPVTTDRYGRTAPKSGYGTANLVQYSSSTRRIVQAAMELFERITDKNLLIRRISITANRLLDENSLPLNDGCEQLSLFTDQTALQTEREKERAELERERRMQKAMLSIKQKYGKNAILKASDLQEGATTIERNSQIGGHQA